MMPAPIKRFLETPEGAETSHKHILFENFGMGRGFFPTDFWQGGREAMMAAWSPRIEMSEEDGKVRISADLPGLIKDDVKVDITEDAVLIEGERKYEHEQREEGVYRSERGYGQFRRQIPLPEGVKSETAKANFKNGVLEVTMEAPQIAKNRRRIQIQGEESIQKPGEKVA